MRDANQHNDAGALLRPGEAERGNKANTNIRSSSNDGVEYLAEKVE